MIGKPGWRATAGLMAIAGLVYAAAAGYSGPDGFAFTVSDGALDSEPATVSITVAGGGANYPGDGGANRNRPRRRHGVSN